MPGLDAKGTLDAVPVTGEDHRLALYDVEVARRVQPSLDLEEPPVEAPVVAPRVARCGDERQGEDQGARELAHDPIPPRAYRSSIDQPVIDPAFPT